MNNSITKENMLFTLPLVLQRDESTGALADATVEVLAHRLEEIDRLRIVPNIDNLEEALLAILARDFKVDWWDPDYSLEEKRRTLKRSWRVHKILGTKAAVETAIRAIYPLTQVEEWFEYGGEPYHFRLNIDITSDSGDQERQKRVLDRLNFYKSLRSHNDGVRYFLMPEKSWAVAGGLFTGSREAAQVDIRVPAHLLKRPGGEITVITGGGLAGTRSRVRMEIQTPPLIRPQGTARKTVSAGFIGSIEQVRLRLNTDEVKAPTGKAATGGAAGVVHQYQRIRVLIRNPIATTARR